MPLPPKLQSANVYMLSGPVGMDNATLIQVAEALGCNRTIKDSPKGLYYFLKETKTCRMR
jgi:hypothetical protein